MIGEPKSTGASEPMSAIARLGQCTQREPRVAARWKWSNAGSWFFVVPNKNRAELLREMLSQRDECGSGLIF
jgi:hypothetical protein